MRTTFLERILHRHFGPRAEPVAEAIVRSPQLKSMLADMDAEQVARRAELVERLRTAPARHEESVIAANRKAEAAKEEVRDAQLALNQATERYAAATGHSMGLSAVYEREKGLLVLELERTADARLESFAQSCTDFFHVLRHYPAKEVRETVTGKRLRFDDSDLKKALAALGDAAQSARAMKLQALSFDEISAKLADFRSGLVPLLGAAGFRGEPPAIDGATVTIH